MPSAFIRSAHGYPAMPLARQLIHPWCVHPGPLVLGPRFSYDMVTAARCPRTGIVPHSRAEVKRVFCSVSWQTGRASLRSAERVERQSSKQGAAEDSCPLHLRVLFRCIMRGYLRNATLQLW